jgi:hypothetical protein
MKRAIVAIAGSLLLCLLLPLSVAARTPHSKPTETTPLAFTKNMGQWDDRVLFRANSTGVTMWFTKDGITYQFTRSMTRSGESAQPDRSLTPFDRRSERDSIEQLVINTKFVGANPNPEMVAEGLTEYKCNFFLGSDPSKWRSNVPNYETVTLKDVYPGVDLRYSDDGNGGVAYEFVATAGADMSQIKVRYVDADETPLAADGDLLLKTRWGDMTSAMKSPAGGVRSGIASFSWPNVKTGTDVTSSQALSTRSISLVYSTYLGGSTYDRCRGIAVDGSGCAYVTGATWSTDFPTHSAYDSSFNGDYDVIVAKFAAEGNSLVYCTFLGGSAQEEGFGIDVDGSDCAYVTGGTTSSDFPTYYAYDASYNIGSDCFVTKLSAAGNSLIYSTYLGGSLGEEGAAIAVDRSACAYVTGSTTSTDFPTLSAFDASFNGGNGDVFVTKFTAYGNTLAYSTYLGGLGGDKGWSIAVDRTFCAYVAGGATSGFPTQNAYDTTYHGGNQDAFAAKLSAEGSSLKYSTYLGGSDIDYCEGIAVDGSGCAYVTGITYSSDFPTDNAFDAVFDGATDGFVTKLSATGNSLSYSTFLGGSSGDMSSGIVVDDSGCAFVAGATWSSDFPTQNAYDASFNENGDGSVTRFSAAGDSLIYSTYLGGSSQDGEGSIDIDASGSAYVAGVTFSSDFPTRNAYDSTFNGAYDATVTKLSAADTDDDGIPDNVDNCPTIANPTQTDSDGDGFGDVCDNCPAVYNPDQADADLDGVGDACDNTCGDANADGAVDISDAVFLIAYIFSGGPAPSPLNAADVNCDLAVDISDAVYLIAYIFSGGPIPCAACK